MPSIWDTITGRKSSHAPAPPTPEVHYEETVPVSSSTPEYSAEPVTDVSQFLQATNFDPTVLHPLAGLSDGLEYISLSEEMGTASGGRGWSDDLCYGTGTTYLTALTIGGAWGLAEGMNKPLPVNSARLRLNTCLNSITRRGPFLGNSAGVIALVYNGINSTIGHYRGKHEASNSIVAGALSGMLFKSTRGPRPMLIAGGITATVAGIWQIAKKVYLEDVY